MSFATADGRDFVHWKGSGKKGKVLYVDGEMDIDLAKERFVDAVRRHGSEPEGMYYLNRFRVPELLPLDTKEGQRLIDDYIAAIGGVDLATFDNVQALIENIDELLKSWLGIRPWMWDLSQRRIGQIWAHHTGHNKTREYGTATVGWGLDSQAIINAMEKPEEDGVLKFRLKFLKKRQRKGEDWREYAETVIRLEDDVWSSSLEKAPRPLSPQAKKAFNILRDLVDLVGKVLPDGIGPDGASGVPIRDWRDACYSDSDFSSGQKGTSKVAFHRARDALAEGEYVGYSGDGSDGDWVWLLKATV
jgi:hypothetical protein